MSVSISGTSGLTFNNGSTQDVGGVGTGSQSWQDVTSSRAVGTTYTNSTGKPIMVIVSGIGTQPSDNYFYVNGAVIGQATVSSSFGNQNYLSAIVPNGATYKVVGGTPTYWSELR